MTTPTKAFNIELTDQNQQQGWAFGRPAGISANQWPRSRTNGLPMAHLFTLLVPEEYRVQGPEFVAISLFQADDHVADEVKGVRKAFGGHKAYPKDGADIFWKTLLSHIENRHPQEKYMEDIIEGGWALIWLTEAEFKGKKTDLPNEKTCVYPEYESDDGMNAYDHDQKGQFVVLGERDDDPNVGRPLEDWPDEDDPEAYIPMHSDQGEKLKLSQRFFGQNHFGGTASPVQATPEFSPFYIEFEEDLGNANMGGGNGQIDLLNSVLDWACG